MNFSCCLQLRTSALVKPRCFCSFSAFSQHRDHHHVEQRKHVYYGTDSKLPRNRIGTVDTIDTIGANSRHRLRLWRLPLDIRLLIYDRITVLNDNTESIRKHCRCQYQDKGKYRPLLCRCRCSDRNMHWLDSAFEGVATTRHDANTLMNLFDAFPVLSPDALRAFCFTGRAPLEPPRYTRRGPRWYTSRTEPTRPDFCAIVLLLSSTQFHDYQAHVVMDLKMCEKKDACNLLRFVVGYFKMPKLRLRLHWTRFDRRPGCRQLQRELRETAQVLKWVGGGLQLYVTNHLCCEGYVDPLQPPSDNMDAKLVGRDVVCDWCI